MYKIRTNDKISETGLKRFSSNFSISSDEQDPSGIILRSYKIKPEEFGNDLLGIARAGAGVNNIPVDECTKQGIVVFNTPGANANAVKELVVAGLLLSSRKILESEKGLKALEDKTDIAKTAEKIKKNYAGPEIAGKTLGVIGLGAIGVMVAQAAVGLKMKVIGYDPYLSVQNAWQIPGEVEKSDSLDEMLSKCDYLSLHVPVVESTKEFVNEGMFSKMKDGIRIMNFARGELVNVPDLLHALKNKKVAKYVSDFADTRLLEEENCLTFPHLGASTPEAEDNCAVMACNQIEDYILNGNITNSVNYPAIQLSREPEGGRVALLHENIPGMLGAISDFFGKAGINIIDMVNKSKDNVAYTLLNVNRDLTEETLKRLTETEGVIKARSL